jgi:hypothetical protein
MSTYIGIGYIKSITSSLSYKEDFTKSFQGGTQTLTKGIMIRNGSSVKILIRIKDNEIINERIDESIDLEEKVEKWMKTVLSMKIELPEEIEKSWDWMDEDYAKRKLGLLP